MTEKSFNAYACIKALLEEEGEIIDEMHLAIYRINQPTVEALIQLMDSGKIRKASFIISSFFSQTKKPEVWAEMLRDYCALHPKITRHSYLHNHAKVLTCKRGDGFYYFEGSGNMSDNARIEQYRFGNSKEIYDFHSEWMDKLILETNENK